MDVHIYALVDPTTDEIRYIGQTSDLQLRYKQHLTDNSGSAKWLWIANLRDVGHKPQLRVLETVEEVEAETCESKWITFYRNTGASLLNGRFKLGQTYQRGRIERKTYTLRIDSDMERDLELIFKCFFGVSGGTHNGKPHWNEVVRYVLRQYANYVRDVYEIE